MFNIIYDLKKKHVSVLKKNKEMYPTAIVVKRNTGSRVSNL